MADRSPTRPTSPSRIFQSMQRAFKKRLDHIAGTPSPAAQPQPEEPPQQAPAAQEAGPAGGHRAPTRADYAAVMRRAVAKMQADADGDGSEATFDEMERAMTGLMELTYGKAEPPLLPKEFATRWRHGAVSPRGDRVMSEPVILASGASVDSSYEKWYSRAKSTCPVTDEALPHRVAALNHLLRDMIAAWCEDHSVPPSWEPLNPPPDIAALQDVRQLAAATKGAEPRLEECAWLVATLMTMHRNTAAWSDEMEEERLKTILALTFRRPNAAVLAAQEALPEVLMAAAGRTALHSVVAKAAAAVSFLLEFNTFRWRVLDAGGVGTLQRLLAVRDAVVRHEAATAMLKLCTDDRVAASAVSAGMPAVLLDCLADGLVTDECLLLLERFSGDWFVLDGIGDRLERLLEVATISHSSSLFTGRGVETAVSLIYEAVRWDVGNLRKVAEVRIFKERLRRLASQRMALQTQFKAGKVLSLASQVFQDFSDHDEES